VGEEEGVVLAGQVVEALEVLVEMVMVLVHQEVMEEEGHHQEEVMEQRDGKDGQLIHQVDVAEVMAVAVEALEVVVADMVEVVQDMEEVDLEAMVEALGVIVEDLEEMVEDLEETVECLVEE